MPTSTTRNTCAPIGSAMLIAQLFDDCSGPQGAKVAGLYLLLISANLVAWAWALVEFNNHPALLATALLAYAFGLRHAVDADHIAAIDNVIRKLMQEGKRPLTVGFFFSLGHSTVVVLATIAVAATALALQSHFNEFKAIGGVIGTSISAAFLLIIGIINLVILIRVWRSFRHVRAGGRLEAEHLDLLLAGRGFLARLFRGVFGMISKSWHMYLLGFLFGLGFDTATEVGLLGISATQVAQGMSLWSMLIFPALFTVGMALVDTTDGIFMVGAYGWAFANPLRKLWYNLTITAVSVVVALFIGTIEALGLLADKLGLVGGFWSTIGQLNGALASFGFAIIGLFIVSWLISALIYRWNGYDDLSSAPSGS
jgi:nickel/cobalt transporter (NiCoT) family protein